MTVHGLRAGAVLRSMAQGRSPERLLSYRHVYLPAIGRRPPPGKGPSVSIDERNTPPATDHPGAPESPSPVDSPESRHEPDAQVAVGPAARPVLRLVPKRCASGRNAGTASHSASPLSPLALAQPAQDCAVLEAHASTRELVTYVSGQPGVGKSTFLLHQILADIAAGRSCVVIDPHGDLVKDVMRRMPSDPATLSRVALFDPADAGWPVGMDLLDARTEEAQDLVVQFMFEMFEELFLPEHQGPVFHQSMSNGLRLVMETGGCLAEVPLLFTEEATAKRLIPLCKNPFVRHYFVNVWGKTLGQPRSELLAYFTSKLSRFLDDRVLRNILSQKSQLDLGRFMNGGGILLADLSRGSVGDLNARMLGMILLHRIARATLERAECSPDNRRPAQVYVDEFHELATPQLYRLLTAARKYNVGFTLAHQRLDMLPRQAQETVVGTAGHLVLFRQGSEASNLPLDDLLWPRFGISDLLRLPNFKAVARVTPRDGVARIGRITVPSVKDGEPGMQDRIREISRKLYARPRAEVEEDILIRLGWI